MNIQIHTEHISISESQEEYIREKLEVLHKYYEKVSDEDTIQVKVHIDKNVQLDKRGKVIMRVTMAVPQALFRAEVNALTVEEAIDLVHDKLNRQIERYKTKHTRRDKITTAEFAELVTSQSKEREGLSERISRRKLFSDLFPMTEEEAIKQMEMLGHSFFIFVNEATDRYNVVYKRPDGESYGLVELEHQDGVLN